MTTPDPDRLYREGVAAVRAGDMATARDRLRQVVQFDPAHEQAWLWLSAAVQTTAERITCLQNVLSLNPNNETARRGLERLGASTAIDTNAAGFPENAPATDPAPPLERLTRLEHGPSRIAESLDPLPRTLRSAPPDEAWRAALQTTPDQTQGNLGVFTRKDLSRPQPDLLDLVNAWGNLLIFSTGGSFADEVRHGGFGHLVINLAASGALQAIGLLVMLLLLSFLSRAGSQAPVIQSLTRELPPEAVAELQLDRLDPLGDGGIGSQGPVAVALLGTAVFSIPILFVTTMFESFIVDAVSRWLNGRGDMMITWQAISMAQVVHQLIQLPALLLIPLLPVGGILLIGSGIVLYQFVIRALAVGKAQDFGILAACGVLIISGIAGGLLYGLFLCLLSAVVGAG